VGAGRTHQGRPAADPAARRPAQLRHRRPGRRHPGQDRHERLGHANVQITLDTYSHIIPGLDEQAAATVARLILEGSEIVSMGSSGSDAANSAANTGDAPHSREEVRGEVPGELGGGGGI
jgi:hypothetical protein